MTTVQLPPFDLRTVYPWMQPDAVFAAHFEQGQYWLDDAKGPIAASSLLTTTRSSSIVLPDSAGVFQTLGNNTLPRTDRGLYANGQITNLLGRSNPTVAQLTNYNNLVDGPGFAGFPHSIHYAGATGVSGQNRSFNISNFGVNGQPFTASILVQMLDGNPPDFGNSTGGNIANTFFIVVASANQNPLNYIVEQVGPDVWKVTCRGTFSQNGGAFNVVQAWSNQNRAFNLCGLQCFIGDVSTAAIVPGGSEAGGPTLMASDIRAVQGVRPSDAQPEPLPGWEAAGLDDGLTVLLDFENRMRQAEARQVVSLNDASNAVVAILDTTSVGTSFRLTASGSSDAFPGGQTGGRSRVACRVMPDGAFALAQKGQGTVTTGTKASPINLASATRLTVGNRPQLDTPWNDWIYGLQICSPLSDTALLDWVNAT